MDSVFQWKRRAALACCAWVFCLWMGDSSVIGAAAPANESALWTAHIQPLLSQNCFKCHGELKQKSGLDLSSLNSMLKGGERGPAIVPGKPADSRLFQFVQPGADPHMPPKEHQLTEEEIGLVKRWIASL